MYIMKNEFSTRSILKGLEVTQKINKSMGKLNMDSVMLEVSENNCATLNSVYFQKQMVQQLKVMNCYPMSLKIMECDKMIKALKKFDSIVSITTSENSAVITDGKKTVKLALGELGADHDKVKPCISESNLTLDGTLLESAYKKVKNSTCKEQARPILCGVHFRDNYIEAVDGFRISHVKISQESFTNDFVIPKEPLDLLLPLAKKDKAEVKISENKEMYTITSGDISITGELLQGEYLDTTKVFNSESEIQLSFIENKALVKELEFVADMSKVDGKPIKENPTLFKITNTCENKLTVCTHCQSTSSVVSYNKIDGHCKDEFKIAFNPQFMLDAAKSIEGEFTISFISPLTQMIIENENEKYLVLPVRLSA